MLATRPRERMGCTMLVRKVLKETYWPRVISFSITSMPPYTRPIINDSPNRMEITGSSSAEIRYSRILALYFSMDSAS